MMRLLPLHVLALFSIACAENPGTRSDRGAPSLLTKAEITSTTDVGDFAFEDRTEGSGIDFAYHNGEEANLYTILESLGGGVALLDYDGDGLLDIFLTGGGQFVGENPTLVTGRANRLYKNLGDWKFRDTTQESGLDQPIFYSHGATVGDFDCDGWPDLFVTGYRRVALYRNESTDPKQPNSPSRKFRDVTSNLGKNPNLPWSTSAAFGDLDGDGYPELFVCQYLDWSFAEHKTCAHQSVPKDICNPHAFRPLRAFLFRNLRNGQFEDISEQCNLRSDGKGLGVVIADLDGDGKADIYVANDASENHLYLNRGNWKFEECGAARGVAVDETGHVNGSMGIAVSDWDRSGWPSLFVTNFQNELHAFYQNMGQGQFAYRSHPTGIARLGQKYVGFGTAFADFDHDGWDDLVITNGHVLRHPEGSTLAQQPICMKNLLRDGRRQLVSQSFQEGYFSQLHRGRGLAVGDLDNDGSPDLVISHQNARTAVLRNRSARQIEKKTRWIGIILQAAKHRSTVGTTVKIRQGQNSTTRSSFSGGYLSQHDSRIVFRLNDDSQPDEITVTWPGGSKQEIRGTVMLDQYSIIREISK